MKNTNLSIIKLAALFALACAAVACQTNTTTTGGGDGNNVVANQQTNTTAVNVNQEQIKPATANNNQTETAKPETGNTSYGSLATPTEAYKTAYAARKNKDVAGLKRVMSKDMLEFFSLIVEGQNKTIDDVLMQLAETPQASTDQSRNEKITGDRATIEYMDEKGNWKTMDFVKEGSDWKLTMPEPVSSGINETKKKAK